MTPEEREAFYDTEVAPALLVLAKKCEDNGLSFVASVEWSPGDTGETAALQETASIKIRMAQWAMACHGNADSLILAMMKHAREHGHNSVCLANLLEKRD